MFQKTRRRLAIWYTAVTAILLLLFATGVYFYVRTTLIDRIDDTLKHVIEVVKRSLVIEEISQENTYQETIYQDKIYQVNLEASFRKNIDAVEDDHIDLEWFNANGKLEWSTFLQPINISLSPHNTANTVHLSSETLLRQVTKPIKLEDHLLGYLRVSHPWFEVTKPIRKLIIDLILGISIMVICVGGIGWFLSGIAIQPVKNSYQSLKQFTADISHELRNPIATIQTNIQMALTYPNTESQLLQQQLKVVERLTQRLGCLVNDLLFLARWDSGIVQVNYQSVPLDALLIEVIEEQRIIAEQKGIFLSLHLVEVDDQEEKISTDDIFNIQGDWEQLARLFTNLISNALQYTELKQIQDNSREGSVEIELKYLDSVMQNRDGFLQVIVKDNGIGIPVEVLPNIFDRFYRVDPSRSQSNGGFNTTNTGLGLAIAKTIVDNHKGQIIVESNLDRGTIFKVILPISSSFN